MIDHLFCIIIFLPVFDESGNFILYATMLGIKGRKNHGCLHPYQVDLFNNYGNNCVDEGNFMEATSPGFARNRDYFNSLMFFEFF